MFLTQLSRLAQTHMAAARRPLSTRAASVTASIGIPATLLLHSSSTQRTGGLPVKRGGQEHEADSPSWLLMTQISGCTVLPGLLVLLWNSSPSITTLHLIVPPYRIKQTEFELTEEETGESNCFDPALAALLQYTLSNLGRGMSDESTGRSRASSLVQSLSREVGRAKQSDKRVRVWGGAEVWIIITVRQKALDLVLLPICWEL